MCKKEKTRVYVINSLVSKNVIESPKYKSKLVVNTARWTIIALGIIGIYYLFFSKNNSK